MVNLIFNLILVPFMLHAADVCETQLTAAAPIAVHVPADPFRTQVLQTLSEGLHANAVDLDAPAIDALLSSPPKFSMGQLAFPCFQLAKRMRLAPAAIAQKLAQAINAENPHGMIAQVEAVGPYVNFTTEFSNYTTWILEQQRTGRFFKPSVRPEEREKISLEFSQPNTHKALHIGHMRNMFLGESVARLLTYFGHQVVRSTYPGDMGAHVAKVLWYIQTFKFAEIPEGSATWLGKMYAEADQYLKDHAEDPQVKAGVSDMLKKIESGEGPEAELYRATRQWSLEEMKDVYAWLGITFDDWYFESECDRPSRELVLECLGRGLVVENEGAIGLDLSDSGLGFVLMLKRDGTGLYLTKDLELLRRKFSDPAITRSIVVVDARQKLHFQQVFGSAERIGLPNAGRSIHLSYETVTDAEGKAFSSRALNGLGIKDLRTSANSPLAVNNLRYGFLKVSPETQIRFDLEQWLQKNGDSATSLITLYENLMDGATRANSPTATREMSLTEKEVVYQLGAFNAMVGKAVHGFDPSEVARYLSNLQQLLRRWDGESSPQRAALSSAAAEVIQQGLDLLGIKI